MNIPPLIESEKMGDEEKAVAEKQLGNDAYKKKDFDTAIAHYTKASRVLDMFYYDMIYFVLF